MLSTIGYTLTALLLIKAGFALYQAIQEAIDRGR